MIDNNLDLVIRLNDPKDSSLIAIKLSNIDFYVCASPEYLSKSGEPQTPEELAMHNCLIYSPRSDQSEWRFLKNQTEKNILVKGNFSTENTSGLINATKQGLGISLMSSWTVLDSLHSGQLKIILSDYKASPRGMDKSAVYILYPHRKHLDKKARVFIDFIKEKVNSLGDI